VKDRSGQSSLGPVIALAISFLFASGCQNYKWGSVGHPEIKTVGVGSFTNKTDQSGLSTLLRSKLVEQFMLDGSVRVVDPDQADVVISGQIRWYHTYTVAQAETRDDKDRDSDRDAYQTTVFGADIRVSYSLRVQGRSEPIRAGHGIRGKSRFWELPDLDTARQDGLRRAVDDAARQLVAAVTEGW